MAFKIDSCKDWSADDIDTCYSHIERIAKDKYQLDFYPNQIEIISSEQMLEAYTSVGMPVYYNHWSFGKQFITEQEHYRQGKMGLAYEIVINSNPCISYLMEENSMAMQALVMAHACIGHNSFFKNNETFKMWTDADAIIDYLVFAQRYIQECEERYGEAEVERVLDAAHALSLHGVDKYKRPSPKSKTKEAELKAARLEHERLSYNDLWKTIPQQDRAADDKSDTTLIEPEENILYFIEKNAPNLDQWKREIIRIVRKIAQYFYPQRLTQIMNEGTASFWHYTICNDLHTEGLATDGFMLEFLASHSNVLYQRPMSRINPYALGFAMFQDIKRICMNPTAEDEKWFEWAGNGDWLKTIKFAAYNFKDESFIMQYLSPKVIRDFGFCYMLDDDANPMVIVNAIQNEDGYKTIREKLSNQQNANNHMCNIQVVDVDTWNDRTLYLEHKSANRHVLDQKQAIRTMEHIAYLWGYDVSLITVDEKNDLLFDFVVSPQKP